ncbi:MAG: hypothetical protein HY581_07800 [Nitrospirae bacterium]|nr:hypothetical protein [Nitrospirota bacterium]
MKPVSQSQQVTRLLVAAVFLLSGCTTLVHDDVRQTVAGSSHCSGSEWADNSSLALLPIPVVAFFVPHWDLHEIKADDYLKRCGDSARLINRQVEVNRVACVPAALTRIISLGIWQWCPARVSWEGDVKAPSS